MAGLQYHRARYYNPMVGVFPSLDALEVGNRYAYVGGNVVNRVDPSGMIGEKPLSCASIAEIRTPQCGECVVDIEHRTAQCRYNRHLAANYAIRWGTDPSNYHSASVGRSIESGTDCTNFASQVLKAGGFLLTDGWYYNTQRGSSGIKAKSPCWSGAPQFYNALTGAEGILLIPAATTITHTRGTHFQNAEGIQIGDLVFYDVEDHPQDHVAIVVGFEPDGSNMVPLVIEHGLSVAGTGHPWIGTIHRYDTPGTTNYKTAVFVRIPDTFMQQNVLIDRLPCQSNLGI